MNSEYKSTISPPGVSFSGSGGYLEDAWTESPVDILHSIQSYTFMIPGMIKKPPVTPIPPPSENPAWFGEQWFQFPLEKALCPLQFGYLFKAKVELMLIIHRIGASVFDEEVRHTDQPSPGLLFEFVGQLDSWYSSLPCCLSPASVSFPSQLKLQYVMLPCSTTLIVYFAADQGTSLLYHNTMIHVCELLVAPPVVDLNVASQRNPHSLLTYSWACFETLIRIYYLRHGFESTDSYLLHHLTMLAFRSLDSLKSVQVRDGCSPEDVEDLRSTVFLAAKGLRDQGRSYYMPLTLFHLVQEKLNPHDVDAMNRLFTPPQQHDAWIQLQAKHVQAQYPVNVLRITENPEDQRLSELVKEYASMTLQERRGSSTSEPSPSTHNLSLGENAGT